MVNFLAKITFITSLIFSSFAFAKDKIIGIVLDKWEAPTELKGGETYGKNGYYANKQHYSETVHELCDGVSVIFIPPVMKNVETYSEMIDGLLIPGLGPDIDPKHYDEKSTFEGTKDKYRTEFELKMIDIFYKQRKPILGICHGMQVINVAFGGKLYQDLPTDIQSDTNHNPYSDGGVIVHEVIVDNVNNVLTNIAGKDNAFMVNSVHHQGVKTLGQGLSAIATSSSDGLIEAVQMKSHPFLVGVQWHPEFKLNKTDRRLIQKFCNAVKNEKSKAIEVEVVTKPAKINVGKCVNKGPTKECRFK